MREKETLAVRHRATTDESEFMKALFPLFRVNRLMKREVKRTGLMGLIYFCHRLIIMTRISGTGSLISFMKPHQFTDVFSVGLWTKKS